MQNNLIARNFKNATTKGKQIVGLLTKAFGELHLN